jgi:hypothetical protein
LHKVPAGRSMGKPAQIWLHRSRYLWHETPADPTNEMG